MSKPYSKRKAASILIYSNLLILIIFTIWILTRYIAMDKNFEFVVLTSHSALPLHLKILSFLDGLPRLFPLIVSLSVYTGFRIIYRAYLPHAEVSFLQKHISLYMGLIFLSYFLMTPIRTVEGYIDGMGIYPLFLHPYSFIPDLLSKIGVGMTFILVPILANYHRLKILPFRKEKLVSIISIFIFILLLFSLAIRFIFKLEIYGYHSYWIWSSYDISLLSLMFSTWLILFALKLSKLGSEMIMLLTSIVLSASSLYTWIFLTPDSRLIIQDTIGIYNYLPIFLPLIPLFLLDRDIYIKKIYPRRYSDSSELKFAALHISFSFSVLLMLEILTSLTIYSSLTGNPNLKPNPAFMLLSIYIIIFSLLGASLLELIRMKGRQRYPAILYSVIILVPLIINSFQNGISILYIMFIIGGSVILSSLSILKDRIIDEKLSRILFLIILMAIILTVSSYSKNIIVVEEGKTYLIDNISITPLSFNREFSELIVPVTINSTDYYYVRDLAMVKIDGYNYEFEYIRYSRGISLLTSVSAGYNTIIYGAIIGELANATRYSFTVVKISPQWLYKYVIPILILIMGISMNSYGEIKIKDAKDSKPKRRHTFQKE